MMKRSTVADFIVGFLVLILPAGIGFAIFGPAGLLAPIAGLMLFFLCVMTGDLIRSIFFD